MKNPVYIAFIMLLILSACKKQNKTGQTMSAWYLHSASYKNYWGLRDSAYYFYNKVIGSSKDSLEKGKAYLGIGVLELEAGDYYSSQENLLSSIRALDKKDTGYYETICASYNSLGNASLELREYDSAFSSYYNALKFAPTIDTQLHTLNNLGVAYQKVKKYDRALEVFDSAMSQEIKNTSLKAMIISNLARTKWLKDSNYAALPEFRTALALREAINDSLGMNASFSHISDYYTNSRRDSAYYYALKRSAIANMLQDPADRLEAAKKLAMISPLEESRKYMEEYIELNDSLINFRNQARNRYALIRFGVEKSWADNRNLQKHIGRQRLLIWGTVVFAVLVILGLVWRARARRARLKQEADNAIRESALKTSQKVHDVVANGLYKIMNELEHNPAIDKEPLLDRIEELYEKSRDISYEQATVNKADYSRQIQQLITSLAGSQVELEVTGNEKSFWDKTSKAQKQQLQFVIEELMINMKKHSRASKVWLRFSEEKGNGCIDYKDNGVGIPEGMELGNGLSNTVNRIKSINGQVIFGKSSEKGASISIRFPLNSSQP